MVPDAVGMSSRAGSTQPRPRVDVGVVTWNTAELTVKALRHLLDTDQGCDLQVLVHDNASEDGTPAALAREVPEALVEVSAVNLGFAGAVNRLLSRSTAPWFFALNSDAWPEPGAIASLVAAAERHPNAAAVVPLLLRPDGAVEHSTHPFPSLTVAVIDAVGGRRWLPRRALESYCLEGAWNHHRPRRVDWAVGAAMLLRRKAAEQVGGLDERFFMYVEDLEWCWRAHRLGWEVRFEPAAVVRHVGNASGSRRWGEGRRALEASYLRLLTDEVLGLRQARAYRGLRAVAVAGRAAAARATGHREDAAYWRGELKHVLGLVAPPALFGPTESTTQSEPSPGANEDSPGANEDRPDARELRVAVAVPTHGRAERLPRLIAAPSPKPWLRRRTRWWWWTTGPRTTRRPSSIGWRRPHRSGCASCANPVRRGPAAARNVAWRATSAPVVAFTDDDCVPSPGWLEAGLAEIGDLPRVVVGRTGHPPTSWDSPTPRSHERWSSSRRASSRPATSSTGAATSKPSAGSTSASGARVARTPTSDWQSPRVVWTPPSPLRRSSTTMCDRATCAPSCARPSAGATCRW